MKKYLFSLLAVVVASMFMLSSCGKDDDDVNGNGSSTEYLTSVTGSNYTKLLDTFISFMNTKADGSAKLSSTYVGIHFNVSNPAKFNALLKNLTADSSELDAAMDKTEEGNDINITITYGKDVTFNYSWSRKNTYADAGTYKYTTEDGKVWSIELTTEAIGSEGKAKANITVPEGYDVEAKTYEGEWLYYNNTIIAHSTESGSKINTGIYYKEADGNKYPVSVSINSKKTLTKVIFTKQ